MKNVPVTTFVAGVMQGNIDPFDVATGIAIDHGLEADIFRITIDHRKFTEARNLSHENQAKSEFSLELLSALMDEFGGVSVSPTFARTMVGFNTEFKNIVFLLDASGWSPDTTTARIFLPNKSETIKQKLKETYKEMSPKSLVSKVILSPDGRLTLDTAKVRTKREKVPASLMYPYMPFDIEKSLTEFIKMEESSALILFGAPGTAKSDLILRLATEINEDNELIMCDSVNAMMHPNFMSFINSSASRGAVIIIEEALEILGSREEKGNRLMSEILSIISGVTDKCLKFVFTTNSEDLSSIDKAIFRRGRCFGVYRFMHLTNEQARELRKFVNKPELPKDITGPMTVADVFNYDENADDTIDSKFNDDIRKAIEGTLVPDVTGVDRYSGLAKEKQTKSISKTKSKK